MCLKNTDIVRQSISTLIRALAGACATGSAALLEDRCLRLARNSSYDKYVPGIGKKSKDA